MTETVAFVTVTEHVAVLLPSAVLTVIVAEPAVLAVTVPSDATVATEVLLEDQETFLFVAVLGDTVADSLKVWPAIRDSVVGETETPVTETVAVVTETAHVAVLPPSVVFTVMVAEPAALAVTVPSVETVATEVLLDDHVTALFVAFDGDTVAFKVLELPTVRLIEDLSRDTPVTATDEPATVTVHWSVFPPSTVLTVITAVPADFAVTTP